MNGQLERKIFLFLLCQYVTDDHTEGECKRDRPCTACMQESLRTNREVHILESTFNILILHLNFPYCIGCDCQLPFLVETPDSKRKVEKRKEFRCCWVDLVSSGLPL